MRPRLPVLLLSLVLLACGESEPGAPDASAPDAGSASSRGSGKLPCSRTGTVETASGPLDYCVSTVAGSELKIIEPSDTTGPLRLALYLHGDGARAHDNGTALRLQAPWTVERRVLYVSARAPNGCAWWVRPSLTSCDGSATDADRDLEGKNAETLVQVIEALRAGWDLADEPVLFGGSSGGAVFLSASFLPRHGARYRGAFALNCGGEKPWATMEWDATDATLRGSTRLSFSFGDRDFLYDDIKEAQTFFGELGFPYDERVYPDAEHCAFDHLGRTTEVWNDFLEGR